MYTTKWLAIPCFTLICLPGKELQTFKDEAKLHGFLHGSNFHFTRLHLQKQESLMVRSQGTLEHIKCDAILMLDFYFICNLRE